MLVNLLECDMSENENNIYTYLLVSCTESKNRYCLYLYPYQ